jgi:tRNA(fMet)-specific endonuclease VapC
MSTTAKAKIVVVTYGEIRTTLEAKGQTIGLLDMLIAAHAVSQDMVLVTSNEKEFMRINNLKVENWTG